jgi:predicted aspartyl protease
MNIPREIADKVIDNLKGTPFVLALLIINIVVLIGFTFTLHQVGNAVERRDAILEKCIK